ncbi:hypothetical protein [Kribbella shirazensis]|uniref:NAD(P)-dependent oxidoreductase n=1 Tax=Kribbella shirazensis TaxID=1105143 RepID=A0A7X5VCT6_9ACTN|nr:hypothetical protein [Kribbella shirazensis]NIK58869.1 hypothetical protein [Kribbella shirazensis]
MLGLPFDEFPPYVPVDEDYPPRADTVMSRPNEELLAEVFPGVPVKRPFGPNETLLSIDKARRLLGYEPQYSWRTS